MPPVNADSHAIIAVRARRARAIVLAVLVGSVAAGAAAALFYAREGLTLSHYDARAHLTVARRVFDSLTPGWRQLGGVWLPLPHLIDLPLVWSDWGYRTGFPAVGLSVLALAIGLASLSGWLVRETGSTAAALVAPAVILGNPNVLYLQSTPMTEPLLLGLSCLALVAVDRWIRDPRTPAAAWAGPALAALVLVRYEGWLVGGAFGLVAAAARWRDGVRPLMRLAAWPAAAIAAFFALSWASTGHVLVTSGFYVADNPARHNLLAALSDITRVTTDMSGPFIIACAIAGIVVAIGRTRRSWTAILPVCLLAAGALPLSAFDAGHPLRVRYMVPLAAACGALTALTIASIPARFRLRGIAAAAIVIATLVVRPPLDAHAPMVIEAQREVPLQHERRPVTMYLAAHYDHAPILASMDAVGHYMQELSVIGMPLRSFVHEGNGDLWLDAVRSPRRHVGWILVESRNDSRDAIASRLAENPDLLDGFTEVASAGDVTLYKNTGR